MTPCAAPLLPSRMGDTVRPRCEAAPPVNGTARRTTGRDVVRHSSSTSASGPASFSTVAVRALPVAAGEAQHRLARRIQRTNDALTIDDEEPGREAGDDLTAQPLGRFRAKLHRALAVAQLAHRIFHRGRHERGLGAGSAFVASRRARRGKDTEDGVGQDAGKCRHDGGQTEEEITGLGQISRQSLVGSRLSLQSESSVGVVSRQSSVGSRSRQLQSSSAQSQSRLATETEDSDCRPLTAD